MRGWQRTLVARTARVLLDVGQTIDRHDGHASATYPAALGDPAKGSLRFDSPCDQRTDPVGQAVKFGILDGLRGSHQIDHTDLDATIDLVEDDVAGLHGAHACLHPLFPRWSGRLPLRTL